MRVRTAMIVIGSLVITGPALAGQVRLVSDTWGFICRVQVVAGMNAPDRGANRSYRNVEEGWSITERDRLCYRRSADPMRCDSGFTEWRCNSHTISGTDEFSLR